MNEVKRLGIIGARGHTGAELGRLAGSHGALDLVLAVSRQAAGEPVPGTDDLRFEPPSPGEAADRGLDAVFLAMPDGESGPWVEAFDSAAPDTTIIDISFDHRLDADWAYGLPELNRDRITGSRRIANPGCYATALQLAIAPLLESLRADPVVFGVSGYSGAGTTPGPRNDPANLADNLIPYRLSGHNHEVESTNNLGRPVRFMPHVHQAFRGLLVTVSMSLVSSTTEIELESAFRAFYAGERLVEIRAEPPELRDGAGHPGVIIGGFTVAEDAREVVVVAAEDNLLKGAAVQALQNLNLALGFPELSGIV